MAIQGGLTPLAPATRVTNMMITKALNQRPQNGLGAGTVRAGRQSCAQSVLVPRLSVRLSASRTLRTTRASTTIKAAVSEEAPPMQEAPLPLKKTRQAIRAEKRDREQFSYLVAACACSLGITATAVAATYYRFSLHHTGDGFPYIELFASLLFTVGAAVGMEMYARYAHLHLWHETWMWALPLEWRADWNKPFWNLHKSHHEPRDGPFEQNDIFAVANALPAIGLILYGFLHDGIGPGLCYGAGLGITIFGMAYMFVHDGMVHKRFPVGPLADVPYFKKVAMAHKLHHSEKFDGAPYGIFLALEELEIIPGGLEEVDKMLLAAELREIAAKEAIEMNGFQ